MTTLRDIPAADDEITTTLATTYTKQGIQRWLTTPNSHLGHRIPQELIDNGHTQTVLTEAREATGTNQ
jgi:hypothetical protein